MKNALKRTLRMMVAMAVSLALSSCDDERGAGGGASAPAPAKVELTPGETMLGGGWVNDWCWVPEKLLWEQVNAMHASDWDAYTIELGGAARSYGHSEEEGRAVLAARYPELVDRLGDRGMKLLVSLQNDNAGEGKHGDTSPPLSEQEEFSSWLINLVASVGRPDVVIVQPCAETKTAAGKRLELACASALSDFTLVNNFGSRPDDKPGWADYNASHPWTIDSTYEEDMVVGDTSTFIRQMDADGNMEGPTDPAKVQSAYNRCASLHAMAFFLYVYDAGDEPEIDFATIKGVKK